MTERPADLQSEPHGVVRPPRGPLHPIEHLAMAVVSGGMIAASKFGWWSVSMAEALGFASGGICVWLTVRENLWTWPIGLVNNVFFFVLFEQSRLFADMWLQVVYFALGIYGWLNWFRGGRGGSELDISRTRKWEWAALSGFLAVGTLGMRKVLIAANDAAPFWDALTTALSLAAQYLLCRKRLENWLFWIVADIIYIPLYFSRQLIATGVLYAVFLVMCLAGLKAWWSSCARAGDEN